MTSLKDFQILKKIGDGAYSSVFKVQRVVDGQIYALKKVKIMNLSEKEKENALNEVRILASIKHPNVIAYKEAFFDESTNTLCPEVWKEQPYDKKSDIWSLGCVIYECATLKPPFRAESMEGLYKKVIKGYYPKLPSLFSHDLNNIIRSLLQVNAGLRPNCDQILEFDIVKKRTADKFNLDNDELNNSLLQTIKFPKKLKIISDKLPKANYLPFKSSKSKNEISENSFNDGSIEGGSVDCDYEKNDKVQLPKLHSNIEIIDPIKEITGGKRHSRVKKNNYKLSIEPILLKRERNITNISEIYRKKTRSNTSPAKIKKLENKENHNLNKNPLEISQKDSIFVINKTSKLPSIPNASELHENYLRIKEKYFSKKVKSSNKLLNKDLISSNRNYSLPKYD